MTELETVLGTAEEYCPLCAKVHQKVIVKRVIIGKIDDIRVKYEEILIKCEKTGYETIACKNLSKV